MRIVHYGGGQMFIARFGRVVLPTIFGTFLSLSAPAVGQSGSGSAKPLDALADCRKITADMARLACFDKTAERIVGARISGDLLALDRRDVVERKRQRFGLADAARNPLGGGDADRLTAVTEVNTTIVAVRPATYARFTLQLANKTVWETIEPLKFPPDTGSSITIKQSGFGGFKAVIGKERPVLVKRQR